MSTQQGKFDLEELRGTIAVVTGAGNNGIGWGICRHAAGILGMHVVAVDLHQSLVESAQDRLRSSFPAVRSLGVQCDVTKPESVDECLQKIQRELPGLRIGAVFANAGVIFNHTILRSSIDEWATTLSVNVIGVVNTIKAFVPILLQQGTPAVFSSTASIGGLVRGDGGGAAYQASKHAVVALTESLSFELARRSPFLRVHVLCPCIVQSALGKTSALNASVRNGDFDAADVTPSDTGAMVFAMSTERHAEQIFDHIAAGNFYMITDNVRPYVDHDFPFDGLELVRERYQNLLNLTLDNSDAMSESRSGPPSSILKGPMFQELRRRGEASEGVAKQ
ncbi:MAG: SDR family NAD(P)-dependent oxidoreductase [Gammaproteobacteria bacterium]|nr:SDR family NAD(P)-dependent oxidoreductase [Gammaproteobacteria bacterium]